MEIIVQVFFCPMLFWITELNSIVFAGLVTCLRKFLVSLDTSRSPSTLVLFFFALVLCISLCTYIIACTRGFTSLVIKIFFSYYVFVGSNSERIAFFYTSGAAVSSTTTSASVSSLISTPAANVSPRFSTPFLPSISI